MSQRITVTDLISEVREMTNEDNRTSVSDTADILPALNRAQNYAVDILARYYKEPLLARQDILTVAGENEYDIPRDALEQRLLKLEANQNGVFTEIPDLGYQDAGYYERPENTSSVPMYYTILGNKIRVYPNTTGTYNLRATYVKDVLPLVPVQGRINLVQAASNYIIVDAVGEDLATASDNLNSFVNIVDGSDGSLKGTFQIQSIDTTNKITFKTVPTRSSVLDLPVDDDLSAPSTGLTVSVDDYICLSTGSCVPFLKKPMANFLVQYAVAEITRKLGGDAGLEEQVLKKFEAQVEKSWVQRPNTLKVRRTNRNWMSSFFGRNGRRWV